MTCFNGKNDVIFDYLNGGRKTEFEYEAQKTKTLR